jgi:hypothetical protein
MSISFPMTHLHLWDSRNESNIREVGCSVMVHYGAYIVRDPRFRRRCDSKFAY